MRSLIKDTSLDLLIENCIFLLDLCDLCLSVLGTLGVLLVLGQNRIGQERIHFRLWYVDVIYFSFYVIVILWKELGLACFGIHYFRCYRLLY